MKPIITYEQFEALEIRAGRVVSALVPDWSEKLLELQVDFGAEFGQKTIFSGIKKWYQPNDLVGNIYPFIINLAERKMGPAVSQGMMLMGDCLIAEELRPVLTPYPSEVPVGSQIR